MQSSRRDLEEQEKLIQEFELRRKIKTVVVPTDDVKVRQMLRLLGEPITLFGERQVSPKQQQPIGTQGTPQGARYGASVAAVMQHAPAAPGGDMLRNHASARPATHLHRMPTYQHHTPTLHTRVTHPHHAPAGGAARAPPEDRGPA